jgi:hypothetical protein
MTSANPSIEQRPLGPQRKVSRLLAQALACTLAIAPVASPTQSAAQAIDDARFRETYFREYQAINGVAGDMVVMEMRDRVELIAGRGSHVGAASNERRVRGFESALLQGLQTAVCRGASAGSARPSPTVVEKVSAAANTQGLKAQTTDLAELSALAQRLLDDQPRERWCALRSLDDIR